jgi:hypothetical protein
MAKQSEHQTIKREDIAKAITHSDSTREGNSIKEVCHHETTGQNAGTKRK